MLANRQDLPTAMSVSEMQERMKLRDVSQSGRSVFIQGCCAQEGQGVWEGLDWLSSNLPSARRATTAA